MRFSETTGEPNNYLCPEAKTGELVIKEVGDELLVYDLKTKNVSCLNQTAAVVWQFCDGKTDLRSLTARVEKKLETSIDTDLVLLALKELDDAGLLKNGKSIDNSFGNLSRREAVKKIGLGSLVALPIVSMIVAPPAAFAASACGPNPPGTLLGTTCAGTIPQCITVCDTQTNAQTLCQSCHGTIQGNPASCPIGVNACVCVCA